MLQALLVGTVVFALAMVQPARPERATLKSPFARADAIAPVSVAVRPKMRCEPPPPAVHDIVAVSKFGRDRRSHDSTVIDAEDAAQYEEATRPVTEFSRRVSSLADDFVAQKDGSARSAHCAMIWMNAWAEQDALLGRANATGIAVRKWELATLASAYLKIRNAPHDREQASRVRRWLGRIAHKVRQDYSRDLALDSRSNNHLNWAAWAVMAAAIADNDGDLFDWSVARFRTIVAAIADDGTLPLELKRRQLAAAYHSFALAPLIMLREGAAANGVPLSAAESARLQKLADVVLVSFSDPRFLEARAGYEQDAKMSVAHAAWLEPYHARTRDPRALRLLERHRPLVFSRLGGNLTTLFGDRPDRVAPTPE